MGKVLKPSVLLAPVTGGASLIPGVGSKIDAVPGAIAKGAGQLGKVITGKNIAKPDLMAPTNEEQIAQAYQNSQNAINQQNAFIQALQGQNALGNQSAIYNQLGGIASGAGPNPALAQLANTTNQNVANQAALMAGQRGASQNAGLIARQAAMQGGQLQQDAVGQAAALQAQQQMQAISQQGQMANQMAGQLGQAQGQLGQTALNQQSNLLGGVSNFNNLQQNAYNTAQQRQAGMISGLTGGITSAFGAGGMFGAKKAADGMAHGGEVGSKSHIHEYMNKKMMSKGGEVPVKVSPGEMYIEPENVEMAAAGHIVGNKIPGEAKVKGDSLKNDIVPAKLEAGGVVIPRTVVNSKDPEKAIAKFVQNVLAKKKGK